MLDSVWHVWYVLLQKEKELIALVQVCRRRVGKKTTSVIPYSYNIQQPYQIKMFGREFDYVCFFLILGLWYVSFAS